MSPNRAAGMNPIITEDDPFAMIPGPPGTQTGIVQGCVISVTRAAGIFPIITFGAPFTMFRGIGGCGAGVGVGAAG